MLGRINSEIIVGMALILLCILFVYAAAAEGWHGYWTALIGYGVDYVLIALGAGFIAHGLWTRASQKATAETPHH